MTDQPSLRVTEGDRFTAAVREARDRRRASLKGRLDILQLRHHVAAVDALISLLEERNLEGERALDRELRRHLRDLEAEVGLPLPRKVMRARTTTRLHAVLLDWQESLLDYLLPGRLNFPDVDDVDSDDLQPMDHSM